MRRTGHRILVDPGAGRKETRNEIVLRKIALGSHDQAAGFDQGEQVKIGFQTPHRRRRFQFQQVVKFGTPDEGCFGQSQRLEQPLGSLGRFDRDGGEIQLNAPPCPARFERTAQCGELDYGIDRQSPVFPKEMRARQRGMAAQRDLDRRREPAELPAVAFLEQEGGLGQIHFRRDLLHPLVGHALGQLTNCGRIPAKWPVRKCINDM